jgi:tetratricopeptide (TPR) repeat protein
LQDTLSLEKVISLSTGVAGGVFMLYFPIAWVGLGYLDKRATIRILKELNLPEAQGVLAKRSGLRGFLLHSLGHLGGVFLLVGSIVLFQRVSPLPFVLDFLLGLLVFPRIIAKLYERFLIPGSIRRGDYLQAQRYAQRMRRWSPIDKIFFTHLLAETEADLGNDEKCLALLQEALNRAIAVTHVGAIWGTIDDLGYYPMLKGEYDDSLPLIEASIYLAPNEATELVSITALLIWYLEQGRELERVLEWLAYAEKVAANLRQPKTYRDLSLVALAAYTWALLNDKVMAERMLEVWYANRKIHFLLVSIQARACYFAASAEVRIGNSEQARRNHQEAVRIDSNGIWGRRSMGVLAGMKEFV